MLPVSYEVRVDRQYLPSFTNSLCSKSINHRDPFSYKVALDQKAVNLKRDNRPVMQKSLIFPKKVPMNKHEKIDYVELPSRDLDATKSFFSEVFGWSFQDYGPEYTSFSDSGIGGGFYKSELKADTANGSALIVLYSNNLEDTLSQVKEAGGTIVKEIFSFPGGRRFHFTEPSGNEFAVWSDNEK